jgi:hypothetical protein
VPSWKILLETTLESPAKKLTPPNWNLLISRQFIVTLLAPFALKITNSPTPSEVDWPSIMALLQPSGGYDANFSPLSEAVRLIPQLFAAPHQQLAIAAGAYVPARM